MTERTNRRTAVAVGVFAAALTLANIALLVLGYEALNDANGDFVFGIVTVFAAVLYVAIGLLIATRARSEIGWFLTGVGICYGIAGFGTGYAAVGLVTSPGSLPAAKELDPSFIRRSRGRRSVDLSSQRCHGCRGFESSIESREILSSLSTSSD
jgi:hypothetical protein